MKTNNLAIILLPIIIYSTAQAELPKLSQKELLSRFHMEAQTFYFDKTGRILLEAPYEKTSGCYANQQPTFDCDFHVDSNRHLLSHFSIEQDGHIQVKITEQLGGLSIKQESFEVKQFSSFSWLTQDEKGNPLTVRFLPHLHELTEKPRSTDQLLYAPHLTIIDQNQEIWVDGIGFRGKYIKIETPKGTFLLSYLPFKGSQKIGSVDDKTIKAQFPRNTQLLLLSSEPFFVDRGTADVFGIYLPDQKTAKHHAIVSVAGDEIKFLQGK